MPALPHEHKWRWNEWYLSDPVDPVYCFKVEHAGLMRIRCSAKLTMDELIERANKVERVLGAYRQGSVEAGIEVMSWVKEWETDDAKQGE